MHISLHACYESSHVLWPAVGPDTRGGASRTATGKLDGSMPSASMKAWEQRLAPGVEDCSSALATEMLSPKTWSLRRAERSTWGERLRVKKSLEERGTSPRS